jgi:hypothetical protein
MLNLFVKYGELCSSEALLEDIAIREHSCHLSLGGAVGPRIGALRLPTIEIGLSLFQTLEAQTFQRRFLRVPDTRLDFALLSDLGSDMAGANRSIVGEHVATKRVQRGVVDIGDEYSFFEVIEYHHARTAAESTEGFLVELGPDAGTGAESQEAYRLPAIAEGHDEKSRAPIFSRLRIADHGALASVIDLRFFAWCRDDPGSGMQLLVSAQLADKMLTV